MIEALLFSFFIELGWVPTEAIASYDSFYSQENTFYIEFGVDVEWYFLRIGGDIRTYAWAVGMPSFFPYRAEYVIYCGAEFGPIMIGWRHLCSHPVVPYGAKTMSTNATYDEFFIRASK